MHATMNKGIIWNITRLQQTWETICLLETHSPQKIPISELTGTVGGGLLEEGCLSQCDPIATLWYRSPGVCSKTKYKRYTSKFRLAFWRRLSHQGQILVFQNRTSTFWHLGSLQLDCPVSSLSTHPNPSHQPACNQATFDTPQRAPNQSSRVDTC